MTRLTPTPIVGFKKISVSAWPFFSFFYLFLIWGGKILSLKQFFCGFGWSVGVRQTKSFGDKLAVMTDCVFIVHISLVAHIFPAVSRRGRAVNCNPEGLLCSRCPSNITDTIRDNLKVYGAETLPVSHISLLYFLWDMNYLCMFHGGVFFH